MSVHIETDELADAAAGALEDERAEVVQHHLHDCARCRRTWSALGEVTKRLAAEPTPPMPPQVARRLSEVLVAEGRRRSAESASPPSAISWSKPTLGPFGADLAHHSRSREVVSVLAACAAAGVIGAASYVLSASAGLGEPSPTAAAVVSSSTLAKQAQALQRASDLDSHRFSRAWRCARKVTTGRIIGLTRARVDGQPALLVYSRGTTTTVTVVKGCETGVPTPGPSTVVSG